MPVHFEVTIFLNLDGDLCFATERENDVLTDRPTDRETTETGWSLGVKLGTSWWSFDTAAVGPSRHPMWHHAEIVDSYWEDLLEWIKMNVFPWWRDVFVSYTTPQVCKQRRHFQVVHFLLLHQKEGIYISLLVIILTVLWCLMTHKLYSEIKVCCCPTQQET